MAGLVSPLSGAWAVNALTVTLPGFMTLMATTAVIKVKAILTAVLNPARVTPRLFGSNPSVFYYSQSEVCLTLCTNSTTERWDTATHIIFIAVMDTLVFGVS